MSDPYRDAEASLSESLKARRAELDAIDETLIPLHERREEVISEIDVLASRLGALRSPELPTNVRRGRSVVFGFGLVVTSAFSAAYMLIPARTHCGGASRDSVALQEARGLQAMAEVSFNHMDSACQTLRDIVGTKDTRAGRDPWRNPYRVNCTDGIVHVTSSGPDGIANTRDDIRDDMDLRVLRARR